MAKLEPPKVIHVVPMRRLFDIRTGEPTTEGDPEQVILFAATLEADALEEAHEPSCSDPDEVEIGEPSVYVSIEAVRALFKAEGTRLIDRAAEDVPASAVALAMLISLGKGLEALSMSTPAEALTARDVLGVLSLALSSHDWELPGGGSIGVLEGAAGGFALWYPNGDTSPGGAGFGQDVGTLAEMVAAAKARGLLS